jgi:hypothetical protein
MQSFDIQVFNRKSNEWQHRTTIDAKTANAALHAYLPSASQKRLDEMERQTRPYTQDGVTYATNRKGKRFRAIREVTPA